MDTLVEVSKLSKYELYRDFIKPVISLCGDLSYERGKSIALVNKDLCVSICGAVRTNFIGIPFNRIFTSKVVVGAVLLDEYFAYDALNICRAFNIQVCLYKGINYYYVRVFINYDVLTSNPKDYLSSKYVLREPITNTYEIYATLCRQQMGGRNSRLCQHMVKGLNELVLVDLKKKYFLQEKDLSRSFIKAMNRVLISAKNPVDSIYCISTFKNFGHFTNEVVTYKTENNEDTIVVYYGVE